MVDMSGAFTMRPDLCIIHTRKGINLGYFFALFYTVGGIY